MDKKTSTNALFEHGERTKQVGNCLIIHGGGLCASSKDYISALANALTALPEVGEVFIGFYSFECFFNPTEWIKLWSDVQNQIKEKPGGIFGTARKVVVGAPETVEKIVEACRAHNITHWFIAGGDGSSHAARAVASALVDEGIYVVFPQVLTLDGVEGTMPLGVWPAVAQAWDTLNDVVATCLMTRQNFHYCPLIFEVMGRNRNNPLGMLLERIEHAAEIGGIPKGDLEVFSLPAGRKDEAESIVKRLVKKISEAGDRRTLILMSEGLKLPASTVCQRIETISYTAYGKSYSVKARVHSVGYTQQMNRYSDPTKLIQQIVQESIPVIRDGILKMMPFTVVRESINVSPHLEKIDYIAKANPEKLEEATLPPELADLLNKYLP